MSRWILRNVRTSERHITFFFAFFLVDNYDTFNLNEWIHEQNVILEYTKLTIFFVYLQGGVEDFGGKVESFSFGEKFKVVGKM